MATKVCTLCLAAEWTGFYCNDQVLLCEIKVVKFALDIAIIKTCLVLEETVSSVNSGFDCMARFVSVQ